MGTENVTAGTRAICLGRYRLGGVIALSGLLVALVFWAIARGIEERPGLSVSSSDVSRTTPAPGLAISENSTRTALPIGAHVGSGQHALPEPPDALAELPEVIRDHVQAGRLTDEQKQYARGILGSLYMMRCSKLDEALALELPGLDDQVAQARRLRNVEVALAAQDALERGLYLVLAHDSPTPPLLPEIERISLGSGGHHQGRRSQIMIFMPHARYPSVADVKDYEAKLVLEQRWGRILTFNQLPIEERRAWRTKFLDREHLSHDEFLRLFSTMPVGTAWDETSATISDRSRAR